MRCVWGFLFFGLVVAVWVDEVFAEDGALWVEDGDFFVFYEGDDVLFFVGSSDAEVEHFVAVTQGNFAFVDAVVADFPDGFAGSSWGGFG